MIECLCISYVYIHIHSMYFYVQLDRRYDNLKSWSMHMGRPTGIQYMLKGNLHVAYEIQAQGLPPACAMMCETMRLS